MQNIKCPECGNEWYAWEEGGELYEEGEHDVACTKCSCWFIVETELSWNWESYPMKMAAPPTTTEGDRKP